ncbi:MAG: DNA topoisomerase IV subunit A [Bacilli bacterium]|nr:DNA topoisomerase IV subunit A [Bacilli bacterium]
MKSSTNAILEKIYNYSLEEIMGQSFGRYSKYIIQDRAIPDVRDGLKPVQRRILYGMFRERNTYDKPYRKSAKTVGHIMGNYHPHGDSSIYDAMVRMSQWWKQNTPYIDMQGNNGSIDGDSPAAMRYTEARLAKVSNELLKDIDKDTVVWAPNFDDTEMEPTVLPAKFPNLLVNGATGISAGYATNIPPHNLGEIIDATIKRIDSPNCRLETIMEIVKGPDFPTGGVVYDSQGIVDAFTSGRGRITVRAKVELEKVKGKTSIIVTEIPFEVIKSNIARKIDEIRIDKKIEGIAEVRDETDKDGIRLVIELKAGANTDLILNYLYKNTELQTTYNYNMIAIVNRRPRQLGILDILDAHLAHYREVVLKRTAFDLAHAKKRLHIVEGLIKAISILDEVIKVIRASKNKGDAKDNLVKEFGFTIDQAEAIVVLQLYRLTNTDIVTLEEELKNLSIIISALTKILEDEEELKKVMKAELKAMKKEYAVPRKTVISEEEATIKIDEKDMIPSEEVVALITKDGYVKRTSMRGYKANTEDPLLKEGDYVIGLYQLNTLDTVLLFTNLGNYLFLPVHEIPDIKWKQLGKHISNIIKLAENEEVIGCIPVKDFNKKVNVVIASKLGMIKKTSLSEFKVSRYSKPMACMKLKSGDEVISIFEDDKSDIFVATDKGYGLWFDVSEIPLSGIKSSGVKSINLKGDVVVSASNFDSSLEYITIFTDKGTAKRVKLDEFEKASRARRGLVILREVKTNPYKVISAITTESRAYIGLKKGEDISYIKNTEIAISDRYKTGSTISKQDIDAVFCQKKIETLDDVEVEEEEEVVEVLEQPHQISLLEIDDKLKEIDTIINDNR